MYIFEAVRGWDEGQRDVRDEMHLYVHICTFFIWTYINKCVLSSFLDALAPL